VAFGLPQVHQFMLDEVGGSEIEAAVTG